MGGGTIVIRYNGIRPSNTPLQEAQKTRTALFWNIWVLLATPAIWLAWSMISFCVSILSFVWRTGSQADQDGFTPLTPEQALGVRIAEGEVEAFARLREL